MKITNTVAGIFAFAIAGSVSAHYIFDQLLVNGVVNTTAVRKPQNNSPIQPINSTYMRCNDHPGNATGTIGIAAGSSVGFQMSISDIYHQGPAAMYLGKAPGSVASWNGSGQHWFKIAEWGVATYKPLSFQSLGQVKLVTTIPVNTPPGEYLLRVEHIGLHILPPESFVSCAQINVTGGGTGNPPKVSIPGYIHPNDTSVNIDIYPPLAPTSYICPGPKVWRG
ncbi:hypothetical protein H0H92_005763 [Tricholoma furcatifolium]|nr:hypothetical protein H0H92_005763 [Tricholoma furcatifolium]